MEAVRHAELLREVPNIRWFLLFRVFFNIRFYYPVFAVLFFDFGVSDAEFLLLNVVWALTIVALEVPSGALSDIIGRKNLIVFAALCMVVEMLLICFAPLGSHGLVMAVLLVNRFFSGMAEAAASGADEALAFDSLRAAGREEEWKSVLSLLGRWASYGFICAMLAGSLAYDPGWVTGKYGLDLDLGLAEAETFRYPLFLTLGIALVSVFCALKMREVRVDPVEKMSKREIVAQSFREIAAAGRWVRRTPFATGVMVAHLGFMSLVLVFLINGSIYYELIGYPEVFFGLLGALAAIRGFIVPPIAAKLVRERTPAFNFALMAGLFTLGFAGLPLLWDYGGYVFVLLIGFGMTFRFVFFSQYLNSITESRRRATVLSIGNLGSNIGFGALALAMAGLSVLLKRASAIPVSKEQAFGWLLPAFPLLAITLVCLMVTLGRKWGWHIPPETAEVPAKPS